MPCILFHAENCYTMVVGTSLAVLSFLHTNIAAEPPPSKPHFTTRLEPEYSLPDGEPMVLKCKVGGYPPPKTLWYKDGIQIKNELPYEISTRGGEQTLKISQAEEDDGGVYSCLATNPSGQDSTSTNVTVAGWCCVRMGLRLA